VTGVNCENAPPICFEAEKTGYLSFRVAVQSERLQQSGEIGFAIGVHLVIPVQREAALSPLGPLYALIAVSLFAEPILCDLSCIADVINISQVNSEVRIGILHQAADNVSFICAGSPISSNGDRNGFRARRGGDSIDAIFHAWRISRKGELTL